MKRILNMTEAEILALTDEDIDKLIDMECAHEGVPLLPPHPGPAPEEIDVAPDVTLYVVVGGFEFMKSEDANKVLAVIADSSLVNVDGYGDDARMNQVNPGDYHYPKVETKKVLSQAKYLDGKEAREACKARNSEWVEAKNVYDKAVEGRQSVVSVVQERIRESRFRDRERKHFCSEFERYLELAEGDHNIAMNFLLKAKGSEVEEEYPELIEELCPGYLVAAKLKGAC